jgi:hypothetical protein
LILPRLAAAAGPDVFLILLSVPLNIVIFWNLYLKDKVLHLLSNAMVRTYSHGLIQKSMHEEELEAD